MHLSYEDHSQLFLKLSSRSIQDQNILHYRGLQTFWSPQQGWLIFHFLLCGTNINNLRYVDASTLTAESEEELKSLLMKVKEESEKLALKLNIQNTKIMASSPRTSQQIDGETVSDFNFWTPKSLQMVIAAMKLKDTYSLEGKL